MRSRLSPVPRQGAGRATTIVAAVLGLALGVGFLGAHLPLFESLAQFRAHLAAALAIVAVALVVLRRGAFGLAAGAAAVFGFASVAPFMLPARFASPPTSGGPRYTLLQMNLRFDAPDRALALGLVARLRPDVVTAQELTPEWHEAFQRLRETYPYQFYCTHAFDPGDVAILSRRPFVADAAGKAGRKTVCDEQNGFAAKTIDFNGSPVLVGSEHLRWPWPERQNRMVDGLSPTLRTLTDPVIVAGDFNSAPWAASVRRYAEASRTRTLAGIGPTWIASFLPPALARYVGLPLDNVLVSNGVEVLGVERMAPTSSDHLPVLVTFTTRFPPLEEPEVRSAGR